MNGYTKIKFIGSNKSRSMDFSDLLSFPDQLPTKPIDENNSTTSPNHTSKIQETKQQIKTMETHEESPPAEPEEDENMNGERFGVILSRNSSVAPSTTSSHRFMRFEKQLGGSTTASTTASLQSAVKRAFSMRRSSSVSERYCRIHDQCVTLAPSFDGNGDGDDFEGMEQNNNTVQGRSMKKKKKYRTGQILKACKRIFGL